MICREGQRGYRGNLKESQREKLERYREVRKEKERWWGRGKKKCVERGSERENETDREVTRDRERHRAKIGAVGHITFNNT
jgi:hypothetical protein